MNKQKFIDNLYTIFLGVLFFLISLELVSYSIKFYFYIILAFTITLVLFLIMFLGFNLKIISNKLLKASLILILTICLIYPIIMIQNRITRNNATELVIKIEEYNKQKSEYPESLTKVSSKRAFVYWVGVLPKKFQYLKTPNGFTLTYHDSGITSYLSDKKEFVPIE